MKASRVCRSGGLVIAAAIALRGSDACATQSKPARSPTVQSAPPAPPKPAVLQDSVPQAQPDGAGTAAQADWTKVYTEAVQASVYLFSHSSLCAGALIAPDVVLTAWHCVSTLRPVTVGFKDPRLPEQRGVRVAAHDAGADLAVLRLNAPVALKPLALVGSEERVMVGQAIATIGHPQGIDLGVSTGLSPNLSFVFTRGQVSRVSDRFLMSDIPADSGNSGGPILNQEGEIIGVASAKSPSLLRSPNTKQVLRLAREVLDGKRAEGGHNFLAATGDGGLGIFYGMEGRIRSLSGNDDAVWGLRLKTDVFDRVRIAYRHSFFRAERLRAWECGWTFHLDATNILSIRPTLFAGHQSYAVRGQDVDSGWKVGLEAEMLSTITIGVESTFSGRGPAYALFLEI